MSPEDVIKTASNIQGAGERGTLNVNADMLADIVNHMNPEANAPAIERPVDVVPESRPYAEGEQQLFAQTDIAPNVQRIPTFTPPNIERPVVAQAPEPTNEPTTNNGFAYAKAAFDTVTAPFEKTPQYVTKGLDIYQQNTHEGTPTTLTRVAPATPENISKYKPTQEVSPDYDETRGLTPSEKRIRELDAAVSKHRDAVIKGKDLREPRTDLEVNQDIATAVGAKGALGLGQMAYGALDLLSRKNPVSEALGAVDQLAGTDLKPDSLDAISSRINKKLTGNDQALSQNFNQAREFITDNFNSDQVKSELEEVARSGQIRDEGREVRIEKMLNQGYSELGASVVDLGGDIGAALESYKTNKLALYDVALESSLQLFAGGAVGKAAQASKLSGLSAAEITAYKASDVGKAALSKAASRANLAYVSASEGLSNAVDAKARVLGKSEETLSSNIQYQDLRKEGMSFEDARMELSKRTFDTTLVMVGLGAGLISKATGASKFEGNLLTGLGGLDKAIPKILTQPAAGAIRETLEEAGQSGLGQTTANTAVKVFADKDVGITKGTGAGIAAGSLAGGLTGAGAGVVSGGTQDLVKVGTAVKKVLDKIDVPNASTLVPESIKRTARVESAIASGNTAAILDSTKDTYKAEDALAVLLSRKVLESNPDKPLAEKIQEVGTHITNLYKEVTAETDAIATPEDQQAVAAKQAKMVQYIKAVGQMKRFDELSSEDLAAAITSIAEISNPTDANSTANQVLNSAPSSEQASDLLKADGLTAETTSRIKSYVSTQQAVEQAKTLEEVNREVFEGSETNMGLVDHMNVIQLATDNNDTAGATSAINNFASFAKGHMAKYLALKQGFAAYKKNPNDPEVARIAEKTGITIDNTTGKLVAATKAEAFALKHALSEASLMMQKKFGNKPKVTEAAPITPNGEVVPVVTTSEATTKSVEAAIDSTPISESDAAVTAEWEAAVAEAGITINNDSTPEITAADVPSNIATDFAVMPDLELKEAFDTSVRFASESKNAFKQTELANRELVKRYGSLATALNVLTDLESGSTKAKDAYEATQAIQTTETNELVSQFPKSKAAKTVQGILDSGEALTAAQQLRALKSLRRVASIDLKNRASKSANPELFTLIEQAAFAEKIGDTELSKELYAKVDAIQNETIGKRDALDTVREYVGQYVNTANLRKTLSTGLNKVKKADGKQRVDKILDSIKKFVEKVPFENREQALRDVTAGLKVYANGQSEARANTPFKRFGLRVAKNFLERPTYTIKRALEENAFLKSKFKVRKTESVLANEKNFFDLDISDMAVAKDLNEEERTKLLDIQEFTQDFRENFEATFNKADPRYTGRNPSQELFNTITGHNTDGNIVAGMAIVAYNYLGDKAFDGFVNDDAAINALLKDKKQDDIVSRLEEDLLADVGNNLRTVAEQLGKTYLRSLGINAPKTTEAILKGKMEISIGFQIIDVLEAQGLVKITQVNNNTLNFVQGLPTVTGSVENTKFINVAESSVNKFTPAASLTRFTTDMTSGRKLMEKLFDVESTVTAPHDTPPEFVQEKLLASDQNIPSKIKKIAEKSSHTKHTWKTGLMGVLLSLDEEAQEVIGGVQHDLSGEHALNHNSILRNNEAKIRGLQHMRDFWDGSADKTSPFYFMHVVWKNFRMGIASNTINIQTDKNHRHVIAPESFTVKIGKSDLQLMDNFYIAVGEALGTSPDKESIAAGVASARSTIDKPVIQEAVDAYIAIEDWGHTPENQAALLAGIQAGGNNMFSLDGISALASQKRAYANGETSFVTDIGREVDGLTNGVALSLLQIVGASTWSQLETMLARTGMFTDPDMTYAKWREQPGNYDSYEDISLGWTNAFKELKKVITTGVGYDNLTKGEQRAVQRLKKNKVNLNKLNALETIVGSFIEDKESSSALDVVTKLGRQLAKDPLMTSNYGAAIKKIIANFSMTVLDKLHEEIAKNLATIEVTDKFIASNKGVLALKNFDKRAEAKAEGAKARARVEELRNAVNTVVGKRVKLDKKVGLTDEVDVANFVDTVSDYFGAPLETAMDEKFGTFVESRKLLVNAVSEATTMFKKMYHARIESEKAERKALDPNFVDLSQEDYLEIERDLKNVMPIMANYFSESVEDGFMPVGKENIVTKDATSRIEYKYSKPHSYNERGHTGTHQTNKPTKPVGSLNSMSYNQTFEDAGPNAVVGQVHGMDAATMYLTMAEYAAVNVHDALIFSLNDVEKGTETFNKAMTDVAMSDFSIVDNIAEMHSRVLDAYASMFPADFEELPNMSVALKVMQQETQQYRAVIKNKIAVVQQYNKGEGGAYKTNLPSLTELGFQEVEAEFLETFNIPKPGERAPKRTAKSIYSKETAKEFLDEVDKAVESLDTRKGRRLLGTLRNEFEINFNNLEVYEAERANQLALVLDDLQVVPVDVQISMPDGAIANDTNVTIGENFLKEVNYEYITDAVNATSEYTVVDLFSTDTDVTTVVLRRPVDENQGTLFSDGVSSIDIENFVASSTREVDAMNSEQIFNVLGKVGNVSDPITHTKHLEKLLGTLVNKVMDPIKLHVRSGGNTTVGAIQNDKVFLNIGRGMLANGTQMSAQETYLHELLHHVTQIGINANSLVSRQLEKMWEISRKEITAKDFININSANQMVDRDGVVITEQSLSYPTELAAAQLRYDYIYNNTNNDSVGRNSYLHEFLVFGTTNRAFMNALDKVDMTVAPANSLWKNIWAGDITSTFLKIVERLADQLGQRITGTKNLNGSEAMMQMAHALASVDNTKKGTIAATYDRATTALDAKVKATALWAVAPLTAILKSKPAQAIKPVANLANAAKSALHTKAPAYAVALRDMSKRMGMTEKNLLGSIAREIAGSDKLSRPWEVMNRIANKMVDQTRLAAAKAVEGHLVDNFEEGVLTAEKRTAVLKGLLKTEISSLLDDGDYSMNQIRGFIESSEKLSKEIGRLTRKLENDYPGNKNYYRKMATSLGSYMATGVHTENLGKMNAHVIANLYGLDNAEVTIEGNVEAAETTIDYLASLIALQKTNPTQIKELRSLVASEFARDPINNGITFTIAVNKDFRERAFNELFDGDPINVQKGYTKEIYDPNVTYEVGSLEDVIEMQNANFFRVGNNPLPKDPLDPNQEDRYLFVNRDGLVTTWQAGATSLTSKKAKGKTQFQIRAAEYEDIDDAAAIAGEDFDGYQNQQGAMIEALFSDAPSYVEAGSSPLVPILGKTGKTRAYRYLMNEQTKEQLLDKNNDFVTNMGVMDASIVDKKNSAEINKEVVSLAYKQFRTEYQKDPSDFVKIGIDSHDPAYKEIYQMLPKEMRMEIKRVWRSDNMYVPATLVPLIFGQRKWSVSNIGKDLTLEGVSNDALRNMLISAGGVLNKPWVKKTENVWQEIMKLVKDVIVVRSGVVLAGNIASNVLLLMAKGVNPKDAVNAHTVAVRAANKHQRDTKELDRLNRLTRIGQGTAETKLRIARLKNSIAVNPVNDLINAGVYQSIVEDLASVDDTYTYKNQLQKWASPVTDKLPNSLKTGLKVATIAQDTSVYKFLRDTTQMSDFVARYSLHEHNLKKGMDPKESIQDIVQTFIDYDNPTHVALQYANDMGMVMFTKFFLRIQRVIADLILNHPGKVLQIATLQAALVDMPDVLDSFIPFTDVIGKINLNPVGEAIDGLTALPLIAATE